MTHQLRAQTAIANERNDSWRRETARDHRMAQTGPLPTTTGPGFRIAFVGRSSIADLRRRIAGAFAEA